MELRQEFELNKQTYKVTNLIDKQHFFAILVGWNNYRDLTTYNGYMNNGDFRTDRALFTEKNGKIEIIQQATGLIGLSKAKQEYKDLITI